jgi:predicted cupin superfamily sugar epimerase
MTPEEFLAFHRAMRERAEDEATARRGRPLQPGDIGISKSTMPSIYYLMRQRPDGTWERVPDDEVPRYDHSEEERRR